MKNELTKMTYRRYYLQIFPDKLPFKRMIYRTLVKSNPDVLPKELRRRFASRRQGRICHPQ
jgi:hypothetical protein